MSSGPVPEANLLAASVVVYDTPSATIAPRMFFPHLYALQRIATLLLSG